jgi:hypothetical protein
MDPENDWKKGRLMYYTAKIEHLNKLESKRELNEKESDELDRVTKLLAKELDAK